MLGQFATEEMVESLNKTLGLDQPLPVRYVTYLGNLTRGDLGRSLKDRRPVTEIIGEALPVTLQLTGAALLIAVVLGIRFARVLSAARPNSILDNVVRVVSLAGLSMPVFWTGLVFIVFFQRSARLVSCEWNG